MLLFDIIDNLDDFISLNNKQRKEEQNRLKNFRETDSKKTYEMKKKLDAVKLENVRSLWYLVISSGKKAIAGSKG